MLLQIKGEPGEPGARRNRRVGELRFEVRAARDRSLEPGARRRAQRRVQLMAALLDRGGSTLDPG